MLRHDAWRATLALVSSAQIFGFCARGETDADAATDAVVAGAARPVVAPATQADTLARESAGPAVLTFGPWHLPDSLLGKGSFAFTIRGANSREAAIATLETARRARARIVLRLARGSSRFENADHSFNLDAWKREIDRYRGLDLAPYVADGTLLGHFLFDEPHDPTNWNGKPVSYADVVAAAAYSKDLWPTVPTGVGSPPTALRELRGRDARGALDFALAQYRPKKGKVAEWRDNEVATAKALGYGLVLSLQVLEGNDGQPLTGEQLRTFGRVLAAEPYACALGMWKWDDKDPSYFRRSDVIEAAAVIAAVARQTSARPCASTSTIPA